MTLPAHLELEVTRRSDVMRAAGPSLPIADAVAASAARWAAVWEWASRDPRRRRYIGASRALSHILRAPSPHPSRPVLRLGMLVRRAPDPLRAYRCGPNIGRVVGFDGRHPIILWRGQARAVSADVDFTGGAVGVAAYRRRTGEDDAAEWRVWSRALVGDARWNRSPRHWGVA